MQTSQQINENSADPTAMLKIMYKCTHCGEDCGKGNKFCNECTYVKNRQEICRENKKLNKNWKCKMCSVD